MRSIKLLVCWSVALTEMAHGLDLSLFNDATSFGYKKDGVIHMGASFCITRRMMGALLLNISCLIGLWRC